jgi:hypothetical protein
MWKLPLMVNYRVLKLVAVVGIILTMVSCAAQPPPESMGTPGFWWGLLHGFIAPFSLIGSFFHSEIRVYAAPNSGWWYDLGFVIGILGLGSGAGSQS